MPELISGTPDPSGHDSACLQASGGALPLMQVLRLSALSVTPSTPTVDTTAAEEAAIAGALQQLLQAQAASAFQLGQMAATNMTAAALLSRQSSLSSLLSTLRSAQAAAERGVAAQLVSGRLMAGDSGVSAYQFLSVGVRHCMTLMTLTCKLAFSRCVIDRREHSSSKAVCWLQAAQRSIQEALSDSLKSERSLYDQELAAAAGSFICNRTGHDPFLFKVSANPSQEHTQAIDLPGLYERHAAALLASPAKDALYSQCEPHWVPSGG